MDIESLLVQKIVEYGGLVAVLAYNNWLQNKRNDALQAKNDSLQERLFDLVINQGNLIADFTQEFRNVLKSPRQ